MILTKYTTIRRIKLEINVPNVKQYKALMNALKDDDLIQAISELTKYSSHELKHMLTFEDFSGIIIKITDILFKKKNQEEYRIPYYPQYNAEKEYFARNFQEEKIVADYTRCSFVEVWEMDIFTFWSLLRDAFIFNMSKSKDGREYLENAYVFMQEKPDRKALRNAFGGGKNA